MTDEKLENLLSLSLQVSERERERSDNLRAGYNAEEKLWEIIFRFNGNVEELENMYGAVTSLFGGYYIMQLKEEEVLRLSEEPGVEYIEKPKDIYFAVYDAILASCIRPAWRNPYNLTGKGVLVAVVDSGERVIIMSG